MAIRGRERISKEQATSILINQLETLKKLADEFKEEHDLDISTILTKQEDSIPLSAFNNNLSSLQIIVKYLIENKNKTYHEAAVLLNRDDRTIWATYNSAIKKHPDKLSIKKTSVFIPLNIFSLRKLSVLESLVLYLKDLGYSINSISEVLVKNYQTIYTTYRRGIIKNEK